MAVSFYLYVIFQYNLVSYLSIEAKQNEGQLIENIIKKYDLRKESSLGILPVGRFGLGCVQ